MDENKKMSGTKKIALLGCAVPSGLLLLVGGCMAAVVGSGDNSDVVQDNTSAEVAEAEASDDEESGYTLGQTFEHGSFEFTVHSVEYGVDSIEGEFGMAEQARGEYIVVEVTAENISSSAEFLSGSDQVLMDESGSMYEYDLMASSDASFVDQLNPGQSAEASLAYDVQPGTEIDHMLINGKTSFDEGVRVDLD